MKFNKIYEDIFKPASPEEVKERKKLAKVEDFKDWVEGKLNINYEDLFTKENINKKDKGGEPALIYAASINNINIVKLLIDKGADVNIRNNYGNTALMFASLNNNIELVNLLIDNGADVNVKDKYNSTALIYASQYRNKQVIDLLKQHGAKE